MNKNEKPGNSILNGGDSKMKRPSFDMMLCIVLTVLWILYWILEKGTAGKLGEGILYALEPPGVLWGLWGLGKYLNRNKEGEEKT